MYLWVRPGVVELQDRYQSEKFDYSGHFPTAHRIGFSSSNGAIFVMFPAILVLWLLTGQFRAEQAAGPGSDLAQDRNLSALVASVAAQHDSVGRATFSPDGESFYFTVKEAGGQSQIFMVRNVGGQWTSLSPLSGENADMDPSVSPDGSRLVFASDRNRPDGVALTGNATALWMRLRTGEGWGEPQLLVAATPRDRRITRLAHRSDGSVCFQSQSWDYYETDFLCAAWTGSTYGRPTADYFLESWREQMLPEGVFFQGGVLSNDGDELVLEVAVKNGPNARLNDDLWISRRSDAGWTQPEPLPSSVNTPESEIMAAFAPGNQVLLARAASRYVVH